MNKLNLTEKEVVNQLNIIDIADDLKDDWLTMHETIETYAKSHRDLYKRYCDKRAELDRYQNGLREAVEEIDMSAMSKAYDMNGFIKSLDNKDEEFYIKYSELIHILQSHFPELMAKEGEK